MAAAPFGRSGPLSATRRAAGVCHAEAQTPGDTPTSTSIVDYALGQGAYQLFGVLVGVLSVALVATTQTNEMLMGVTPAPILTLIQRSNSAVAIIPVTMAYCMQAAVANNRLDSPTYKRMGFTMALAFLGVCALKCYQISQGYAMPMTGAALTSVIELLPTVAFLKLYGMSTMSDIIPGVMSGVTSVFQPDNITAAVYSLLTVAVMLYVGCALVSPATLVSVMLKASMDNFGFMAIRVLGCFTFLLGIVTFTLKDAADRGRLGYSTFKALNIGALVMCVAKFAAMGSGDRLVEGGLLTRFGWITTVSVFGVLAVISGYNILTAKQD